MEGGSLIGYWPLTETRHEVRISYVRNRDGSVSAVREFVGVVETIAEFSPITYAQES